MITIGGKEHPYAFGWLVFENISAAMGHNSPDKTANELNGLLTTLSFAKHLAYEAIKEGYRRNGESCPFANADELAAQVEKFAELKPLVTEYTEALLSFYGVDVEESGETKKKNEPLTWDKIRRMCYGYGLREVEMNEASPRFVALFLQGNLQRENERIKAGWEQARFIASSMSKGAAKIKFPWERQSVRFNIPDEVWDRFTPDTKGKKATEVDIKMALKLN